jgi:hypothetical protein
VRGGRKKGGRRSADRWALAVREREKERRMGDGPPMWTKGGRCGAGLGRCRGGAADVEADWRPLEAGRGRCGPSEGNRP